MIFMNKVHAVCLVTAFLVDFEKSSDQLIAAITNTE